MGRRKKRNDQLQTANDADVAMQQQSEPNTEQDDPYSIPLHSRQAAFAILWLLVYSFAMFTLPFGAFYGMKSLLLEQFQIDGFNNTCGSVLAAVLTVNGIIILYAMRGFKEVEEEDRDRQMRKANDDHIVAASESSKTK
ncbi:AGAP013497-PA-like protein [Anopheles sinensis]|uniref:AGAP013497-PA-like protein n=1 Tax=Anopheles sinensis TaxID=74873 RepID=A0A084VL34_ANOSI|nr:AGAP013497-PA-like protein [Anopheles sinensis]